MQIRLRVITLHEATEKSFNIAIRYWKNEWLDTTIIISYFGGINNIFADYIFWSISFKVLFESNLIFKWCYYRQTIFYQSNTMVPYVDIIGLYHSVAIL